MNLRILTPTLHGMVDYSAAAGLILLPFLLGIGETEPMARWIAVATGVAVIVVSALTDYRLGLVRTLPFAGHLAIDTTVAVAFLMIPGMLGLSGLDAWYYWANAGAVFVVVILSDLPQDDRAAAAA